ncbi:hypothetical protein GCM10027570_33330 [Streptomonospora sediminis]
MPSSAARSALTAFATLVLLSLIVTAQSLVPPETHATEPIPHSGDVGETVDARQFTITVKKVRFAETVADGGGGIGSSAPVEANGVWVVATAELTAASAPLGTIDAELVMGDGYTYSSSEWLSNGLAGGFGTTLSPGISVTGALVFEVPTDRLKDPTLQVNARESLDDRLSARADISLGLNGTELAERADNPEQSVSVPAPTQKS